MKRTLPLFFLLTLFLVAVPAFAFHEVATSSDLIRLWKAGWKEDDLLDFIEEQHLWVDLSTADVADMAEAGMSRDTINQITRALDKNEPAPERTVRPGRSRRVTPAYGYRRPYYGYYDPWYTPHWSTHIDFGHFDFGHHGGGHFGGGHHGGGHHGGH